MLISCEQQLFWPHFVYDLFTVENWQNAKFFQTLTGHITDYPVLCYGPLDNKTTNNNPKHKNSCCLHKLNQILDGWCDSSRDNWRHKLNQELVVNDLLFVPAHLHSTNNMQRGFFYTYTQNYLVKMSCFCNWLKNITKIQSVYAII